LPKAYVLRMADLRNSLLKNDIYKEQQVQLELRTMFYSSFLSKGDLCFDIGANLGNRIDGFLNAGARVIALEPQKFCCDYLKMKFAKRIVILNKAVAEKEGMMDLFVSDSHTLTTLSKDYIDTVKSTRFKHANWKKSVQVQVTTLDHLISEYGIPRFIKIDVEGFEFEVLKGLNKPIDCISFEYNTPEMKEVMFNCIERLDRVSSRYVFNYSEGESMIMSSGSWKTYADFRDMVEQDDFLNTGFGDIYCRIQT